MSVEFYRESHGKFDSRTLNRKTLNRWTGRSLVSRTRLRLRGGEYTADRDTVASNRSTGNCLSNFNKRISSKSSNREI